MDQPRRLLFYRIFIHNLEQLCSQACPAHIGFVFVFVHHLVKGNAAVSELFL